MGKLNFSYNGMFKFFVFVNNICMFMYENSQNSCRLFDIRL
jgi:hypothetical protein